MKYNYLAYIILVILIVQTYVAVYHTEKAYAAEQYPSIEVSITNDTVIVTNPYYSIKINLSWGARITDWNITSDGQQVDLIQSDTFYPSLNFISYTGNPPTQSFPITYENQTTNTTYPYPMMYLPWNAELVYNGSDKKILALTPGQEASTQIEPLQLTEYLILYADTPYIDVFYVLYNPTGDQVSISSNMAGYGIIVELSAYTGISETPQWNHTYMLFNLENASEVFNHTLKSQDLITLDVRNEKIFYIGAFQTEKGYVSILSPIYTDPAMVKFTRTFLLSTKLPIYAVGYAISSIAANSSLAVGIRVLYGDANPYWLSRLNADRIVSVIDNDTYMKYLKYRSNFTDEIDKLNTTIQNQNDYIEFLREKAQNATSQLNEALENASYWKTEYNVLKQNIDDILSRSKIDVAKALLIAVVGLAIGFYGGRVFASKK